MFLKKSYLRLTSTPAVIKFSITGKCSRSHVTVTCNDVRYYVLLKLMSAPAFKISSTTFKIPCVHVQAAKVVSFFLCSILTSAPIKLKTAKVQANASKYYSWRHYDTFYFLYLFTNRSQRFRKYGSFHVMPKSFTPFRLKAAFVFTMYVSLKCSTLFALSFLDVHISISM